VARIRFDGQQATVIDSNGYRQRELVELCVILTPYRPQLVAQWNRMHPDLKVSDDLQT